MSRIRSIKPEFWTDGRIVKLTMPARLLFIGLWNFVDDEGRAEYDPESLKLRIFPADTIDVGTLFQELQAQGMVVVYAAEGRQYLTVRNFTKHQKIDKRYPSKLPAPPPDPGCSPDSPRISPITADSPRVSQAPAETSRRNGMEGNGEKPSPRAKRSEADPRFKPCVEALNQYWVEKHDSVQLTFGKADGQQLSRFLDDNPRVTPEVFQQCLQYRAQSDDVVHSEPPRTWLASVLKYLNGPLDRYGKPKAKAVGATVPAKRDWPTAESQIREQLRGQDGTC